MNDTDLIGILSLSSLPTTQSPETHQLQQSWRQSAHEQIRSGENASAYQAAQIMATLARDGSDDDQDEYSEERVQLNLDTRLGDDSNQYKDIQNIQPGTRYKDLIIDTIVEDGEEENVPIL